MAYSVNLLPTVAECDAALSAAAAELRDLNHRADNLDYSRESSTDNATEVQAEIGTLNTIIPTLAAGTKARKTNEVSLRRATNRQADLNDRLESRGPVALLTRELDLAQVQAQITETNAYTAAITARRAAL